MRKLKTLKACDFGQIPDGRMPLYHRIVEQIREYIRDRKVPAGTKLPSEDELAQHFSVSSITIRAALKELADSGLIDRRQGRGTFVRSAVDSRTEWSLASIEDIVMTSRLSDTVLVQQGYITAPPWVHSALSLPPKDRAFNLQIIRQKEGRPFMLSDGYFPPFIGDQLAKIDVAEHLKKNSLLIGLVEEVTGEHYAEIRQSIVADIASSDIARKLGIPEGTPLLVVRRMSLSDDGRVLQAACSYCCTLDYAFSIHVKRS